MGLDIHVKTKVGGKKNPMNDPDKRFYCIFSKNGQDRFYREGRDKTSPKERIGNSGKQRSKEQWVWWAE